MNTNKIMKSLPSDVPVASLQPTLYGLLAQLNEEINRGYDILGSTRYQINRLTGSEPELAEKSNAMDELSNEMPSCIDLLDEYVVRLRVLNNRNDNQLVRLQNLVG